MTSTVRSPRQAPCGPFGVGGRHLLVAILFAVGIAVGFPTEASAASAATPPATAAAVALPMAPWDCKTAPTASLPDTGLPGFFDPPPDPPPGKGDPWAANRSTTIYDQYGYAGLGWNTYDTGCVGGLGEMDATIDTFLGNAFMSGAVWISAATNGIHNRVAHPEQYMQPLDDVVAVVTARLNQAIWSPWGVVSLLAVAALLLFYSLSGRLSAVILGATWAVLVLVILSGISQYPTRIASFFDQGVTQSIASVNQSSAGLSGTATGDPTRAQGALIVDEILYQAWLRGEFGDPDSPAARKWGPLLFRESTFSRAELAAARAKPDGLQSTTEQKANDWIATTQQIQDQDPLAYAALQGKAKGRAGAGFMAFIGAVFTALFRLVADLFVFAGLVMLRLLVMFFPAAAVFGIIAPMSTIVRRIGNIAGASVINVVAFSVGSAIHAIAISAIVSRANDAGMGILSLVLCLVVSLAAFVLLLPLLSFTNILGYSPRGQSMLRTARRSALGYLVGRKAVGDGTEDADKTRTTQQPTGEPPSDTPPGSRDVGPVRYVRRVNLPVESIGRRFDSVTTSQPEVPETERQVSGRIATVRAALPGRTQESTGRQSAQSRVEPGAGETGLKAGRSAPAAATVTSATPDRTQSTRFVATDPRQPRTPDVSDPGRSHVVGAPAVTGRLVDDIPAGIREIQVLDRTHDSNAEVTPDGIRTRLYDPGTKTMISVDPSQSGEGGGHG